MTDITIMLTEQEQALLLANENEDALAWSSIARKVREGQAEAENPTPRVFVSDTPRNVFIHSMFTTAMEGGIGYWSVANAYHWTNGPTEALDGFYADIEDMENDNKPYRIDSAVIERGIERIVKGHVKIRADIVGAVMLIDLTNGDEGDFDAETADCIVQAGLFGEVVYG